MNKVKNRKIDRLLSVFLAVIMVFSMMPATIFVNAAEADYTITVKNEESDLISGATVDYTINVDGEKAEDGNVTTNENGVAVIDLAEYADEKAEDKIVTIICNVAKDGYVAKDVEITVDVINGNTIVTLEEIKIDTVDVVVSKTGNGSVKINGAENVAFVEKDTEVEIKVVPAEGSYIKSLTINGTEKTVVDGEEFTEPLTASEDISVVVVFSTKYTVTVNGVSENGTVKLNDSAVNSLTVDSAEKVKISVTPAEGYQIASVILNGAEQLSSNATSFEEEVSSATIVDVIFVKVYQVTVTYNSNGTVKTDSEPDNEGGEVSVVSGESSIFEIGKKFQIIADPNENYRVSEVKINNEAVNDENIGVNDKTYTSDKFEADKDYSFTVTFAPNVYNITVNISDYGQISSSAKIVEYNGSVDIVIIPNEKYNIASISVNGTEVKNPVLKTENDGEKFIYSITGIAEDKNVVVTFESTSAVSFDNVDFNDEDKLRYIPETNTYVFAKGTKVTFKTDKSGIKFYSKVNSENESYRIKHSMVESLTNSCTFESNVTIGSIWLWYLNGWKLDWHPVKLDEAINIVFDETDPIANIIPEIDANSNGYHKADIPVNVTVEDSGDFSGIKSVTYVVKNGEETTQEGVLYTYLGNEDIKGKIDDLDKIIIDSKKNNSPDVKLIVTVTDRANNSNTYEKLFKINSAPPSVSIVLNGKNEGNYAELTQSNHYQSATATITFTDRADTFNKASAENSIKITAKDFNNDSVDNAYSIIWDGQTATVTFNKEAHYTLKVESYNNKADLSCSSNEIKDFYVDKKAPTGEISAAGSTWKALVEKITFGIFKDESIKVTATATDAVSGVQEIAYYKDNGTELLTDDQLDELYETGEFVLEEYTVGGDDAENERFVVYARITDNAGMYKYIGTNGIIYDNTESSIAEFDMPEYPENQPEGLFIYNDDIEIGVEVTEVGWQALTADGGIEEIYSGLKEIKYAIYTDRIDKDNPGTLTAEGTLFKAEIVDGNKKSYNVYNWDWDKSELVNVKTLETLPAYQDLVKNWNGIVKVDSETNNNDNVTLVITATDNVGKVSVKEEHFSINIDSPIVNIEIGKFDKSESNIIEDKPVNTVGDRGYYSAPRQAVITLTERMSAFNETNATQAIKISAVDSKGTEVENAYSLGEWSHDEDLHSIIVYFKADANYTFSFEGYVNNAMKAFVADKKTYFTVGNTLNTFTVDTIDPTGTVTVLENTWDKLLRTLTFGLFSKNDVEVTATYEDATSLLNKVEYYKTTNPIALSFEELNDLYADTDNDWFVNYEKFTNPDAENIKVSPDEQFVIYYRIEDKAGNYTYINSDGCIVDDTHSDIVITPSEPLFAVDGIGNYNGDVKVDISVSESEDIENYSGIKSIEYWVIKDGTIETQRETLYSFEYERDTAEGNLNINDGKVVVTDWATGKKVVTELEGPTQAMLKKSWSGSVVVDAEDNNSCNVVLYVKTVDNSGNEDTKSVSLDIDITAPAIDVTYDNNKDNGGNGYFDADRTATVVITERTAHFNKDNAIKGIVITAVNAKGQDIENAYTISDWKTVEGATPDEAKHTATIHFAKDANYTFDISYTDNSENKNTKVNTGNSVAPYDFTVDTVNPFATVKATSKEGRETEWDKLITDLTFGFWSREEITITSTSDDETSPIASVEYYISEAKEENDASNAITTTELDAVNEWKAFEALTINDNKRFTVYLKITDNAGNYSYISSDGLIVDEDAPIEEVIAPEVTVMPEQPINGFYNGDVKVAIKVVDPLVKGSYSGLKTVSYKVYDKTVSTTEPTQSGTLYTFETENPKQEQLLKEWTGQITINSAKNNSNDIFIEIFAEDNSLNTSRDAVSIMIDTTAPVIDVTYNNNDVDSDSFFNADRTATIVVAERNFNPEDVVVNITNTEEYVPEITEWIKTAGTGNLDDTKWTTTVTYNKDGDYTFDIEYTDLAANKCNEVNYEESKAPKEFTIDKTVPVVSVSYDNNNAKNGKYFASVRTATILINEHNFDINRVNFVQTAKLEGSNITIPNISWQHSGDIHTATINYTADGDYTFDVTIDDKAGNGNESVDYGNSVAGKDFTVDKTIAKPTISGVVNGKAYKDELIPSISFSDTNYDTYEVRLLRTRMGEKNVDVTSKFIKGISQNAQGGSDSFDTFEKIADNDGIYTLNVKMIDKAGNEASDSITFTVNRFGSVYEYDNYLIDLIINGGSYIVSILEDLIITEYNADRLIGGSLNIEITCDGKPLSDVKYELSPVMNDTVAVGSSGWFQYMYTISKDNFTSDGIYKIYISSEDATGNKPENSNYEDKAITFMVDSTAPEITSITGLEEAIVNATEQEVKYTVFDTIGLKSIKVLVDGNQLGTTITDFSADLNNYSGSFTLTEKSPAQEVQIVVEDLAGNVTDTDSEDFASEYVFNSKVTVSTNFFVRWFANKPLFFGSIAGFIALIAAIIFIVVKRRKKNEK